MIGHVLLNMNEMVTNDYSASHQALDIVGEGHSVSDVVAYDDGVVEKVVKNVKKTNHNTKGTATYGNFVKVKHDSGIKTLYAHLKYGSVNVDNGQKVTKGQKLGTMGDTGNAFGVHLHFEMRDANEVRQNPSNYKPDIVQEPPVKPVVEIVKENNEAPKEMVPEEKSEVKTEPSQPKTENITVNDPVISNNYLKTSYNRGSIVDGLKSIGVDSSFDNRTIIAGKNGIDNYRGTYEQNVYLLKLLKQGKLKA